MTKRNLCLTVGAGLLTGVVVVSFSVRFLTSPPPGSVEGVFSRIRAGMSLADAIAVLDTLDRRNWGGVYYSGTTKDGRPFRSCASWDGLPVSGEIERREIQLCAEQGGTVHVFLGRGGAVTGKRLHPEEPRWPGLVSWVSRVFGY
jgi:hypothetical protein